MGDLITLDWLTELRRQNYRQTDDTCIHTEDEALSMISDLGFCWLIDLSDADLPSLHLAMTRGKNPWGEKCWWNSKQTLPGRKACWYSKMLRGRGTFISWECFPQFYAVYASGNDYSEDYGRGIMSRDEKRILELIADEPEISSRDLRRRFGSQGKAITRAMDRALQNLQETMKITVAGGSLEGWTVHNWALVEDWVEAEHLDRARRTDRDSAIRELILRYVRMSVAASAGDIAWVFRWKRRDVASLVEQMASDGFLRPIRVEGLQGRMFVSG